MSVDKPIPIIKKLPVKNKMVGFAAQRPEIVLDNQFQEVFEQTKTAVIRRNEALIQAKDSGAVFLRDQGICRIKVTHSGRASTDRVTARLLQLIASRASDFYKRSGDGLIPAKPDPALMHALIAAADHLGLPYLEGTIQTPAYRPDFSLISDPGYDAATRLFYVPPRDLRDLPIPTSPSSDDVSAATHQFRVPLSEFGFKDEASAANYLGAALAPLFVHCIPHLPMFCIRAAQQAAAFKAFVETARRYAELTKSDPLIHRKVVCAVNGLTSFIEMERKRVPGQVLWDAERLECLLFSGYDPHFEGDEPPGL